MTGGCRQKRPWAGRGRTYLANSLIEIFSQTFTFHPFLHSPDNFLIREVISRHLKECLRHMPRAPGLLSAHLSLGFTFCFGIPASPRCLGVSHYMLWFIQKFWLNFFYKSTALLPLCCSASLQSSSFLLSLIKEAYSSALLQFSDRKNLDLKNKTILY